MIRGERNLDRGGAHDLREDGISLKGAPREDNFITGHRGDLHQLLADGGGTRAGGDLLRANAKVFGEYLADFHRAHIRVAVDVRDGSLHGLQRAGQRLLGCLVGGELQGVLGILAGDVDG